MFKHPLIRRFTWVNGRDTDIGEGGWQMKGFESLDAVQGFGLAHDALEHYDATLGMDAEMMAFGAILWGRWDCNWLGYHGQDPAGGFVSEIERFLHAGGGWCTPRTTHLLRDEDVYIAEFAEDRLARLKPMLVHMLMHGSDYSERPLSDNAREASARVDDMLQWMRRGVRRTEKRWSRAGGQQAFMDAFEVIAEHRYTNDVRAREYGDKLTIKILGAGYGAELKLQSAYGDDD